MGWATHPSTLLSEIGIGAIPEALGGPGGIFWVALGHHTGFYEPQNGLQKFPKATLNLRSASENEKWL